MPEIQLIYALITNCGIPSFTIAHWGAILTKQFHMSNTGCIAILNHKSGYVHNSECTLHVYRLFMTLFTVYMAINR